MVLESTSARQAPRRRAWLEAAPSWWFLAVLAAIVLVVGLLAQVSRSFYVHYVWKYYWGPIAADAHGVATLTVDGVVGRGGYNLVNTASWALLLGLLLLWAYRVLAELGERMDTELTIGIVPYLLWGSVYHVLEDADLFAPYGLVEPGGGFFDKYLGAFFITPLIWLEIVFIAVLVLWLGHRAQRIGDKFGTGRAIQFYAYVLLAILGLYVTLWASRPAFIRYLANPLVAFAAALLAFWIVLRDTRRLGRLNPCTVLFATGIGFLFVGLYYVGVWETSLVPAWGLEALKGADAEPKWWVFGLLVVGVLGFTAFVGALGRALSRPKSTTSAGEKRSASTHLALLIVLAVVAGLVLLYGSLGACYLWDPAGATSPDYAPQCNQTPLAPGNTVWAGLQVAAVPVVFYLVYLLARKGGQGTLGTRPELAVFTHPVNLLMVAGQTTDALMTAVGVDFFGYHEKHVLPTALINLASNLPPPFGTFATTLVMIPLKLLIVLGVVWLIDVSAREDAAGRENFLGLIKLAILMVGLSPGVRNAVRLAMVT